MQVIAESQARLGTSGRLVIRASGTEPVIRVMAESDDEGLVAAVVDEIAATIKKVAVAYPLAQRRFRFAVVGSNRRSLARLR